MRNNLSTVIGFGILTVLLTAGAAQSLAGTNTVDSGDIIDRTIGTQDVKVGAFAGQTILDNSMTTLDINESTLRLTCATVPAPDAPLTLTGDICYGEERPAAAQDVALTNCAAAKLRLPTLAEARLVANHLTGNPTLWTQDIYLGDQATSPIWFGINTWTTSYDANPASNALKYRCVTTVGARP